MGKLKIPIPQGMIVKFKKDGANRLGVFIESVTDANGNAGYCKVLDMVTDYNERIDDMSCIKPIFKADKLGTYMPKKGDIIHNKEGNLKSVVDMVNDDFVYVTKWNENKSNELIKYTHKLFYNLYNKGEWKLNENKLPYDEKVLLKELRKVGFMEGQPNKKYNVEFSDVKKGDILFKGNGTFMAVIDRTKKRLFIKEGCSLIGTKNRMDSRQKNQEQLLDVQMIGEGYFKKHLSVGEPACIINRPTVSAVLSRYGYALSPNPN